MSAVAVPSDEAVIQNCPRAVFSPCKKYRYVLWRECDMFDSRIALFIGLNPSTATEYVDDPTVTRETRFCERWGYGRLCKTNLFGYRATDPKMMKAVEDPNGPDNDYWISTIAKHASLIVLAWGNHGTHMGRACEVLELLKPYADRLYCLGVNQTGEPQHPLYIAADTELTPFPTNTE